MQTTSLQTLWSAHLYQGSSNLWPGIDFFSIIHTNIYLQIADMTFRINEGTPRTIRFLKELKEPRISHFSTECEYHWHTLLFLKTM
jgi:hypothetical protein